MVMQRSAADTMGQMKIIFHALKNAIKNLLKNTNKNK